MHRLIKTKSELLQNFTIDVLVLKISSPSAVYKTNHLGKRLLHPKHITDILQAIQNSCETKVPEERGSYSTRASYIAQDQVGRHRYSAWMANIQI